MVTSSSRGVPKRCADCRKVQKGTQGKAQWCDCGGEMIAMRYGTRRKMKRGD